MSDAEVKSGENSLEISDNQGDRWTFVAVLPESSFIQTVYTASRNLEEATKFMGQIKAKSDGCSPLISSDDWFYEKAILAHYGYDFTPPYAGRGRYPLPKRLPLADLKYVQVQKKRDKKGRLEEIKYAIIYGSEEQVAKVYEAAIRCKTINTVYVESRNGKFRKDDARLIRKTLCHSKKAIYHDAQINLTAQIMNYTRTNDALKVILNPNAAKFEQKYLHRTPAMAQNLIENTLSLKELLCIRPQIIP